MPDESKPEVGLGEEKVETTHGVSKLEETSKPSRKKSKLPIVLGSIGILALILFLIVWYSRPIEVSTNTSSEEPDITITQTPSIEISKRVDIKEIPVYPNSKYEGEQKLELCKEEPYNLRVCDSYEYSWTTKDSFEKVVGWFEDDKSGSGWKLTGGAGSDKERFGSLIKNGNWNNNLGLKINGTKIKIYIPYTSRAH